jgi:hypothetical protein
MSKFSEKSKRETTAGSGPSWLWIVGVTCVVLLLWTAYYLWSDRRSRRALDHFAQCLKVKGTKMYGAWWCPHCADQKHEFGDAFGYVNYVECSPPGSHATTEECKQADIKHFPTWQFPNGSRKEGVLPLEELGRQAGCMSP